MNGSSWLTAWAESSADRPALVCCDEQGNVETLSWSTLLQRTALTVCDIERQGFVPGDRLVHSFGNGRRGVLIALASLLAGTIEVPLDPAVTSSERDALLRMVDGRYFEATKALSPSRLSDDLILQLRHREASFPVHQPAIILFTSGSTGDPRGVTLSRSNLFLNARAKLLAAPQKQSDTRLTLLPLWHAYARTCDLMTWLQSGCCLAIGHGWDGWQSLSQIAKPTLINTVPSLASRLLQAAMGTEAASRLRMLGCGGAVMPEFLFQDFCKQGLTVIHGYGLTEASPVVCSATPQESKPGFVGKPVDGCEPRIGDGGRLEIRGHGVMLGYWNDAEATRQKIKDGWLDTGDCVEVDSADGQFRILGRNDDRITLSNGLKFFPGPIEQRVSALRGIHHALLLPNDRHVDLILDIDPAVRDAQAGWGDVELALQEFPSWQRPQHIHVAASPFSSNADLITPKGTLRRKRAVAFCLASRP